MLLIDCLALPTNRANCLLSFVISIARLIFYASRYLAVKFVSQLCTASTSLPASPSLLSAQSRALFSISKLGSTSLAFAVLLNTALVCCAAPFCLLVYCSPLSFLHLLGLRTSEILLSERRAFNCSLCPALSNLCLAIGSVRSAQ